MALRWDLKPAFPNAREGSFLEHWTVRSVITGSTAFAGWAVLTWHMDFWMTIMFGVIVVLAFDAGDMRQPFEDGPEPKLEGEDESHGMTWLD